MSNRITFTITIDPESIKQAIVDAADMGTLDVDESSYDVNDVEVEDVGGGQYVVTLLADRTTGKFISNDDLRDEAMGLIDVDLSSVEVEVG